MRVGGNAPAPLARVHIAAQSRTAAVAGLRSRQRLACPKRSGNAPEYADIAAGNPKGGNGYYEGHIRHKGANVCTDPDCFDTKKTAHLARAANELERRGKVVIGGNRARAIVSAQGEIKGG